MKRLLAALIVGLGILAWHGTVQAACTSTTYIIGGKVTICTSCCYYGNCTVTCT